jgi:hypothetical protein
MSSVRRFEMTKRWGPVAAAMILTAVTIGFLLVPLYVVKLLSNSSAPVRATPPVVAEQTLADQTPREPAAPYRNPDDRPANQMSAFAMPRSEPSPAPQQAATSNSADSSPSASEQRVFQSRRALEIVDPQELLRQRTISQ